jgi:tRNA(Ile)-lysidine synthetase-like protein
VHPLAQRVLSHIRRQELLRAGDRVGVAVSGGIDSVGLLRLLLELRGELGIVLSVVHFNHKLRGAESEADAQFVAELACAHDLEFHSDSDDVAGRASEQHVGVEAAARELRYGFFRYLIGEGRDPEPQGLKPIVQERSALRGPEGPLFHGDGKSGELSAPGTAEAMPFPDLIQGAVDRDQLRAAPQGRNVKARHGSAGEEADKRIESRQGRHTGASPPFLALSKIATGHTLDDQAETVLMRMIRGAGMRGLGGIYPRIPVEDDDGEVCGEIVRPLLGIRRRELEQYLKDIEQVWREDSTNADAALTRNRVRKLVVPLLEKEFNPAVAENLAELAEIARGEEDYWENEIAGWMGTAVHWLEPDWAREAASRASLVQIGPAGEGSEPNARVEIPGSARDFGARLKRRGIASTSRGSPRSLAAPRALARDDKEADLKARIASAPWLVMNASVDRLWFLAEPTSVQRRLVKAIGEHAGIPLEFNHVEEILRFAAEEAGSGRELSLPLGWKARRDPDEIVFLTPDLREPVAPQDYEYDLPIPGTVIVNEIGTQIEAQRISADAAAGYNPEQLLDAGSVPGRLRVRNWRPGDRFWPAHTKSPKKVKELLQERHIAPPERKLWPVVVSGDEIVWVRGFPSPGKLRARLGREAILIVERPIAEDPTA